jgi:hypothetical protein
MYLFDYYAMRHPQKYLNTCEVIRHQRLIEL